MGKLDGKIALITGGNSGIGLSTAAEFVKEGAFVFITGRRQVELDEAVKKIGKNVIGIQGDVSKLADLDRAFAKIKAEKGRLDIVFANSGIATPAAIADVTEELYNSIFDINVKGLLFTVQKSLPLLVDGSSIILNASIVASKGFPSNSVYSASKAAVRSFGRTLTVDLKDRKIRVNTISPGPVRTPGFDKFISQQAPAVVEHMKGSIPAGRFGEPSEIAKVAVFLASSDSSYITGAELFVDGGAAQV